MKWQVGTVEDLLRIGMNRLTLFDWWQQVAGLFAAFSRVLWWVWIALLLCLHAFAFQWFWAAAAVLFIVVDVKQSFRIPHRDRKDVLMTFLLVPSEIFSTLRAGWFIASWTAVAVSKLTGRRKDRWQLQYVAEGIAA